MATATPAQQRDSPLAMFGVLSWRINALVLAALFGLAALAWIDTVREAHSMHGMAMGLGHLGMRMTGMMSAGAVLGMWITMMAAMMLPTMTPMVLAHLAVARQRGEGGWSTIVFVAGYFVVWTVVGVVPLGALWAFALWGDGLAQTRWLSALAGIVLVVAGAYQFSGWKQACLNKCITPFGFVATHDFSGGARSALRAGIVHGAYCLGCCWALMAVLLVVGIMNVFWMVLLFAVFFVEKHWRHGMVLARVAGAALVLLGIAVVATPELLTVISS